jgi:cyclophilin family peptidyl-prolyl cis-trans isomerase
MSSKKTRERQLAKLAARRAAERRKKRQQRVVAATVGILVATGGLGFAAWAFIRDEPDANAGAQPTPPSSPGANCAYNPVAEGGAEGVPTPAFAIDVTSNFTATVKTSLGSFTLQLFPEEAPCTVNNFVYLAQQGFYDGLTFHRVADDPAVIQGGDPAGDGSGGPGYQFADELDNDLTYRIGTLAMANSGPATNGSQFFIVTGEPGTQLPKNYTIFGRVKSGMDVVDEIHAVPRNGESPKKKVVIEKVTIKEVAAPSPPTATPTAPASPTASPPSPTASPTG